MNGAVNNLTGVLLVLIPALPLAAALLGYLFAARRRGSMLPVWIGGVSLLVSSGLAGYLLLLSQGSVPDFSYVLPWLTLPDGQMVPLAFHSNQMQLIFALTTGLISFTVMVFAGRERSSDNRRGLFCSTLTLFSGAMLLFLVADTLILVYLAWELMGLCSYLLIAHPGTKEAWRAARQAFWTTRAADTGLFFAVIILMTKFGWMTLGAIDIRTYLTTSSDPGGIGWMTTVALLIILAVIGKAAQFPLCFWLPDAMVAPAPVSALLHAATMVAAGPYLMIRTAKLYLLSDTSMLLATIIGGLTLLLGAVMALCAREPKKILAYSTVSHLGLVVMSVGVLADEFGYFHLIAHAWFKAALFLGIGFLVAAWLKEHGGTEVPGLSKLAGYARRHPLVLWGILVPAGLSLAGVPFLAGAIGKEQVLYALLTRYSVEAAPGVFVGERFALAAAGWWVGSMMMALALPLTAAYITRLVGLLGFAKSENELPSGPLSEPKRDGGWAPALWLTTGLAIVGSIGLSVWYFLWFKSPAGFVDGSTPWRLGELNGATPYMGIVLGYTILAVALGAGITWALRVAKPQSGDKLFCDGGMAPLAGFFRNGMYLRELFTTVVGRTGEFLAILAGIADIGFLDWLSQRCGRFGRGLAVVMRWIDEHIIDGLRWCVCEFVWQLKRAHGHGLQTGQIQFYMLVVLISAVLLCFVIIKPLTEIMANILGRM